MMKKYIFALAVASLFVLSCEKENKPTEGKNLIFHASIENVDSKATLNGLNFTWSEGDQIGIYVTDTDWTTKNQQFDLNSGAGTTQGEFVYHWGNFKAQYPTYAFFPWTYKQDIEGNTTNTVIDGNTLKVQLPKAYYNYTSAQLNTPLVAKLDPQNVENITFKYLGGAVSVTINNVPAGAHSIGMTVPGQNIFGEFTANADEAGTTRIVASEGSNSTVWLNFPSATEARSFNFVFPVPTLTSPKLQFVMYDDNDVCIWSKKLKAQPSVERGTLLEMPALDIDYDYYANFTKTSEYKFGSDAENKDWTDVEMLTDGTWSLAQNIIFIDYSREYKVPHIGEFKIHKSDSEGKWYDWYPNDNYCVTAENGFEWGTSYDILFNHNTHEFRIIKSGTFPNLK